MEKSIHCDLSLSSCRTKKVLHLLCVNTHLCIDVAHKLFGVTSGIGTRNRAPRKGEEPATMHNSNVIIFPVTRFSRCRMHGFAGLKKKSATSFPSSPWEIAMLIMSNFCSTFRNSFR